MSLAAIACSVWLSATPALPANIQDRRPILLAQLAAEERDTAIWYWAWGIGYAIGTAGQFALWPWTPPSERPSLVTWGIASGVGAVLSLALRPKALGARKRAEEGDADAVWVEVHDDEVFGRSVWQHLGAVLINVIPYLVLGVAYRRWEQELPTLISGILIGEAQIFTFPQLLRRYGVR
jgi:hypothetical protein